MAQVDFYYDIASPYSYLASTQMEALAKRCDAQVRWCPVLLGGIFKATGNSMPAVLPARAKYMMMDLTRWARHYDVPFRLPGCFPMNSLAVMRTLTTLTGEARVRATQQLYHAHWGEGRDVSDPSLLAEIAGSDAVERARSDANKMALRHQTQEAIDRGAFGAPSFAVGGELYFGNDRLHFVEQALKATP